jgi:hypothetical protein
MIGVSSKLYKVIPSPLWGGLGWGSLRHLSLFNTEILQDLPTPTPALPTRGREKNENQPTEKLIRAALKELATG